MSEYWNDIAKSEGSIIYQDESKTVYTGVHTGKHPAQDKNLPEVDIIFQVTERHKSKDSIPLLFPEWEIETFRQTCMKTQILLLSCTMIMQLQSNFTVN